jgi:N-acyl-D-amino-acid deacylase
MFVWGSDGCNGLPVDWDTVEIAGLSTAHAKGNPLIAGMVGKTLGDNARTFRTPLSPEAQTCTTGLPTRALGDPFNLFLYTPLSDCLSTTIVQHVGHEDNVRKVMRHLIICSVRTPY